MDTKELKIRELSDVFRPNPDKGIYPAPLNAWFVSKPLLAAVETIIYNRNTVYPGGSRVKELVIEALVSAVNDVNYGY